jgi:hypothetical protein
VPDVAWSYETPLAESGPIAGCVAFYLERVKIFQDLPSWFAPPPPAEAEASRAPDSHPDSHPDSNDEKQSHA